jgi:hypothetical protein
MHTITMTKMASKAGSANWRQGLSMSLTSFLAIARPKWPLQLGGRLHHKVLDAGCVVSPSAYPFAMLVASDVSTRSYGLVP